MSTNHQQTEQTIRNKRFEQYHRNITQAHKEYLEKYMKVSLAPTSQLQTLQLIEAIRNFTSDPLKQDFFNEQIRSPSLLEKMKYGALAVLSGAAVGVASNTVANQVPAFAGAPTGVQSTLAILLGSAVTTGVYKYLVSTAEGEAVQSKEQLQIALEQEGLTNSLFKELSEDIAKLFYIRDALVLGAPDRLGKNLRDSFIKSNSLTEFSAHDINQAIETFFLMELSDTLNKSFDKIEQLKQAEIEDRQQWSEAKKFFYSLIEDPKKRSIFIQQMQITFMKKTAELLAAQIALKETDKYTVGIIGLMGGLITGAITAGLIIPFSGVTATAIGVSILATAIGTAVTTLTTYYFAEHIEYLQKPKRSLEDIERLENSYEKIEQQINSLKNRIQKVKETTEQDLKSVNMFRREAEAADGMISKLWRYFTSQKSQQMKPAIGSANAWLREHAARYRQSFLVEVDLKAQHKQLFEMAEQQTQSIIKAIKDRGANGQIKQESIQIIIKFISDTTAYFSNEANQEFISNFNLKEKIKDQILDIVSALGAKDNYPDELKHFYINELGGSEFQLKQAKLIAQQDDISCLPLEGHPLYNLRKVSDTLQTKLKAASKPILFGDRTYHKFMAYNNIANESININNIDDLLENSFQFLLSLNYYQTSGFNKENFYQQSVCTLYRTLLYKQLADLSDPNNHDVSPKIKQKIIEFISQRTNKTQQAIKDEFNNIQCQKFLISSIITNSNVRSFTGNGISKQHMYALEQIASAIRLNLVVAGDPISCNRVVEFEKLKFAKGKNINFLNEKSFESALSSENSYSQYKVLLKNHMDFIEHFRTIEYLNNTNAYQVFLIDALNFFETEKKKIMQYLEGLKSSHPKIGLAKELQKYLDECIEKIKSEITNKNLIVSTSDVETMSQNSNEQDAEAALEITQEIDPTAELAVVDTERALVMYQNQGQFKELLKCLNADKAKQEHNSLIKDRRFKTFFSIVEDLSNQKLPLTEDVNWFKGNAQYYQNATQIYMPIIKQSFDDSDITVAGFYHMVELQIASLFRHGASSQDRDERSAESFNQLQSVLKPKFKNLYDALTLKLKDDARLNPKTRELFDYVLNINELLNASLHDDVSATTLKIVEKASDNQYWVNTFNENKDLFSKFEDIEPSDIAYFLFLAKNKMSNNIQSKQDIAESASSVEVNDTVQDRIYKNIPQFIEKIKEYQFFTESSVCKPNKPSSDKLLIATHMINFLNLIQNQNCIIGQGDFLFYKARLNVGYSGRQAQVLERGLESLGFGNMSEFFDFIKSKVSIQRSEVEHLIELLENKKKKLDELNPEQYQESNFIFWRRTWTNIEKSKKIEQLISVLNKYLAGKNLSDEDKNILEDPYFTQAETSFSSSTIHSIIQPRLDSLKLNNLSELVAHPLVQNVNYHIDEDDCDDAITANNCQPPFESEVESQQYPCF